MKSKYFTVLALASCALLLSACGASKSTPKVTPTPRPASELKLDSKNMPKIVLSPREDGHELTMNLSNIPSNISQIDYELLYTASDNGNDIEKGLGDTIKLNSGETTIERKLLLGTASCTNGCKYKYDDGINGGTLTFTLMTTDNQSATLESPFTLTSSAAIKKTGDISLKSENFSAKAKPASSTEFFILVKNYQNGFSIFSSGSGKGTVGEINPSTLVKADKTSIVGDYLPQ